LRNVNSKSANNGEVVQSTLNLPEDKRRTLDVAVKALCQVPNVAAIVLGGSYASGFARADSDVDIGLYYREAWPFDIQQVRGVAHTICRPGTTPVVTEFHGWGPWVNGGAWIQTPTGKVDFLYRNIDQVEMVIEEGQRGIWRHDYDQQPPFGFRSVVYLGETRICLPLHDPKEEVARLKKMVAEYPAALKTTIMQQSLWNAEFSLHVCRAFEDAGDVYNTAGTMTRVAQFLVHALFAMNEEYFVSDKSAMRLAARFAVRPRDFSGRLAGILAGPAATAEDLRKSADALRALWAETVELSRGAYQPRYQLEESLGE
jgi:hypothetical protein